MFKKKIKFNRDKKVKWMKFAGTTRAQEDEDGDGLDANAEELCQDRPGDEYFRLSTEGDCRDVVR